MNFKSIIWLVAISISIFIYSCSKNSLKSNSNVTSLSQATKEAITAGNLIAIKQSYSLLSNNEKQLLWDAKWDAILRNDNFKLTNEQRIIVTSIRTFVDSKTIMSLMKNPVPGEVFIKTNLPYFEKYFTKAQLYMLIECPFFCENFSIFKSMDYLQLIDRKFSASKLTNTSMVEPDPFDTDPKCECYYSLYCSAGGGGGGTCTDGSCTKNANCGVTGTSNCTGTCK